MASDVETSQESQAASGESDLWAVTEILAEKGNKYRVQWDGTDPETGEPWPPSWIPKTYATQALVDDWKEKKAQKAKRKRQSKSNASKATSRSRASTSSTLRNGPSATASTSTSTPSLRKPASVMSVSSVDDVPSKTSPSRKRRASPDISPNGSNADGTSRPLKRRKVVLKDVLVTSPSQDATQSSYEVVQNKTFGKNLPLEEEDSDEPPPASISATKKSSKGKAKQSVPPHEGQEASDNDEEVISTREPRPSPPKSILRSNGPRSAGASGSKSAGPSSMKKKVAVVIGRAVEITPNTRVRMREEEEESTQEAMDYRAQETTSEVSQEVPHLDLLSIGHSRPRKRRILQPDETLEDLRVSAEDISIPQTEHDDMPGVQFDPDDDYATEHEDPTGAHRKESPEHLSHSPLSAVQQSPLSSLPPSTPNRKLSRNGNTGSLLISRMKGNQSFSGPASSPTHAPRNPASSQTTGVMKKNAKKSSRKTLRTMPVVTPSKFAPHLPQLEPPVSSIEDFTPDKTRLSKKNLNTETDEIVDPDDSLVTDLAIQQRGQELAEKAALAKKQERAAVVLARQPLPPPTSSPAPEDPPEEFARGQSEDDILQEMEDQYVDLSGGFPEDEPLSNGKAEATRSVSPQVVVHARQQSEEVELPPTESIQANTDSQGKSQESDLGKTQPLNNAINLLHEKSEEIESLHTQMSEQAFQLSALQAEFKRLQADHDALLVHKEVQGDALTEAKEYVKTLGNHVDSLEQKNESINDAINELTKAREEDRDAWRVEREMLADERDELAKQVAELDQARGVPTQGEEWSQDVWLGEKEAWLEKERLWGVEKAEWEKKSKTWDKEREKLDADLQSARKDNDFFREQQAQASSYAQTVRAENSQLEQENDQVKQEAAIARGQAKEGVKLVKDTYELRLKKLEEELDKTKRLCDLLRTKDERTNDDIRRLAGMYPELEEENARLRAILDEAYALKSQEGSDVESDHNPPSSLGYADDRPESPTVEEHENDEEGEGVYICEWARCGAAIETLQALKEHTASEHGIRKLGVLFP